ncbi:MAG TPA: ATPase domain-containing protein [Cyanobacteria bacterium UBA11149]|nr:ATPase domain-containing protein [Cyanobacteria bacterium UBA11367]HBE59090.1 ATPase domain-containing protein [Cyanobacteria bacterium UBA11366]HBK64124.1 ATPase domain-containing protein [Cyanobacteria bacterium UBA11166]HBR72770.1 ATPase domain-containing protein [Cyanobacteria bacterium UBA11159]HBS67948.1 ATPase domain-containing protein [Cyanobacteria bacterium UBA11153]HBW87482.1 ATPase domain-containing protein [Cyanobacteria bacterium UBA11149]HCA94056.1 ATPase domain-containing p
MSVIEFLQFVDQLVFQHTGNHLNNLQKNVVQGIWQGKTYSEIADEFGYDSENHIGNVSRELYKILSKHLKENFNKSNFRWTIERLANSNSSQQVLSSSIINNSHINLCANHPQDSPKNPEQNISTKSYHDLTLAPKITHFYGRKTQLETLSHWLTQQNTRLISILGVSGIGKTTLVKHFIDINLEQFDVIVWKSIKLTLSLDDIITEILAGINTEPIKDKNKLTQLFNLFRQQRCLLILDDVQKLFVSGEFAGQYKTESKDYKTFFTMMTETEHQSSLILISQEQCQEMISLDEELYPVKSLELEGLDNTEILKGYGLKDESSWLRLIQLYEGNPVYLKNIAILIKKIFLGKVSEFLMEDSLILTEDIKFRFNDLFARLSPGERQIILELSKTNQPMSREDLRQALSLSSVDLINGLQSLSKRYLLKTTEEDKILFNLSPVWREYVMISP